MAIPGGSIATASQDRYLQLIDIQGRIRAEFYLGSNFNITLVGNRLSFRDRDEAFEIVRGDFPIAGFNTPEDLATHLRGLRTAVTI